MSDMVQYTKVGNILFPCGETTPRLPAGFYNIERSPFGYGIAPAAPVSDDLIDIPGTPADDVIVDIRKFIATKERYVKAGLTHKRGYLFYGPPGTGKTSLGLMIARRFIRDVDGVVFYIPNSGFLMIATDLLKKVEPARPAMFLMEEADSFLNDTQALSILDGELSLAGAVFVAMTNYKENMPPRIANRPGRFDRVVYIGAPPRAVQVRYLEKLLERLDEKHPGAPTMIADALEGISLSMAHLREAFIAHVLMGVSPDEIRNRFEVMSGATKPEDEDDDGFNDVDEHDVVDKRCTKCYEPYYDCNCPD